ncbi:DUF7927 domain-containing protein [Leucobacter aridicollis]
MTIYDVTPQLDKSFSPTRVPVGDISRLTLTITNTSELAKKAGWAFTDTLPAGLEIASPSNLVSTCDADVSAPAGEQAIDVTNGVLDRSEVSCTIELDVTSESPRGAEPSPVVYTNGPDNISNQVGINDPDPATVEFYSENILEISKASTATANARVGDEVTYTVKATSAGTADYTAENPAVVADDLSGVLDDADLDADSLKAEINGVTVAAPTVTGDRITWSGSLSAGEEVVITYTVTLKDGGDRNVKNVAFKGDPDNPEKPTPDCEAPAPDVVSCVEYDLPKVEIAKTSDAPENALPGDIVTYTVTAQNVGPGVYTEDAPAVITDDLTKVLDDGELQGDVTADKGTLDLANVADGDRPIISWSGPLAVDETVTITYQVKLGAAGDGAVRNVAYVGEDPETPECTTDEQAGKTCAVVEYPKQLPGVKWAKVNADGSEFLAGSEWTITPLDENGDEILSDEITVIDCEAASAADCTGADQDPSKGALLVKQLVAGEYLLTETKAPTGYKLLTDPIEFTINTANLDEDGIIDLGEIVNEQQDVPAIPLTGGLGTLAFLIGAGGIAFITAMLLLIRHGKNRLDSVL